MGIPGLTNFVERRFRRWKVVNYDNGVIIDGNNLYFALQRQCKWALGGEYDELASKIEYFFGQHPFKNAVVVLDGALNGFSSSDSGKDTDTENIIHSAKAKRKKSEMAAMGKLQECKTVDTKFIDECHHFVTGLIRNTFISTLRKLNVDCLVIDGESDKEIAALATERKCPVLSRDSDFFIFDLKYGFIHFNRLLKSTHSSPYPSLYFIEDFVEQFGLNSLELCLWIPAYYGNSFIHPMKDRKRLAYSSFVKGLSGRGLKHKARFKIAPTRCHFKYSVRSGCQHAARLKKTTVKCRLSHQRLKLIERKLYKPTLDYLREYYFDFEANQAYSQSVPNWLYEQYREGKIPRKVLEVSLTEIYLQPNLVETIDNDAAWRISRPIRQQIYHILKLERVTEVIRQNHTAQLIAECVSNEDIPPSIEKIPLQVVLHTLLKPENISDEFFQLEDHWKLPIAATCFWYKRVADKWLLFSLLMSFLTLHGFVEKTKFDYPQVTELERKEYLEAFHAYSNWQCVYYDAISLNSLARTPLHSTSPAKLYSGEIVMSYALNCGLLPSGSEEMMKLLRSFWTVVTGTDLPTSNFFAD